MNGVERIAAERARQQASSGEGFGAARDDKYTDGELALAGACYALPVGHRRLESRYVTGEDGETKLAPVDWPWDSSWWKPGTEDSTAGRLMELAKAGALIAAEMDRLLRIAGQMPEPEASVVSLRQEPHELFVTAMRMLEGDAPVENALAFEEAVRAVVRDELRDLVVEVDFKPLAAPEGGAS